MPVVTGNSRRSPLKARKRETSRKRVCRGVEGDDNERRGGRGDPRL